MYSYEPKSHNYLIYLTIAVFCFVIGWQTSAYGLLPNFANTPSGTPEETKGTEDPIAGLEKEKDLSLFWTVWSELDKKYVDENAIDDQNMIYGAIKGMAASLNDPYTVFMTPKESKEFNDNLDGTLEGIGAELSVENENLVIVFPLKNSPAMKAGLLAGDIIYKIDGELANDMTLFDAIMKIRGKKGTTVILTIIREKVADPFDVSIQRDSIDVENVTVEKLENEIIYLSVNQFNDKTVEEFNSVISEMILTPPKGLIIDLRNNGGGYLDTAVDLLSFLLPANSNAVQVTQRDGTSKNETMKTNGSPKLPDVPLVVLVNKGSASASEIVAGAIQDYKRGVVMGTQSFGKGSVQEVESFTDGSSIRMTIAKWLTPKGHSIDKVGLTPDIIVELSDADAAKKIDTQKNAAIEYLQSLKK